MPEQFERRLVEDVARVVRDHSRSIGTPHMRRMKPRDIDREHRGESGLAGFLPARMDDFNQGAAQKLAACLESTASASAYASSALRKHDSFFILSHTSLWYVAKFRTGSTAIIPSECMALTLAKLFQCTGSFPLENLPCRLRWITENRQ